MGQEFFQVFTGFTEKHFSVAELMKMWGLSRRTVTRLFENEPGVLKLGHGEGRQRRRHWTLRVPESVATRVHRRNTQA